MSLALQGLKASLQGVPILYGVDLELPPHTMVALLGRNGAGKTTTLRTVMGLAEHTDGDVRLDGVSLRGLRSWQRARQGIFYVPEDGGVFQDLTVAENLQIAARRPPADSLEPFPELGPLWRRRAALLSGGERKILALARAFVSGSRWLLVDEPSLGLAPGVLRRLAGAFATLREQAAILLVEQNLSFAQAVADQYVLMRQGETVDFGPIDNLRNSQFFAQAMHFGAPADGSGEDSR